MLSEALRLIRVFHDLKQSELASQLEISNSFLSEIERGKKEPSMELVGKYALRFGIPASSILFFSENIGDPSTGSMRAKRAKGAIAGKVISFLQLVESRSENADTHGY